MGQQSESTERLCVLTVHAHPDDEASKGAPTLAKYSQQGVHTVLVCCTGGEEGDGAPVRTRDFLHERLKAIGVA